jgi:hypothetical protein
MSNVLGDDKRHQIVALGRLGWSLRALAVEGSRGIVAHVFPAMPPEAGPLDGLAHIGHDGAQIGCEGLFQPIKGGDVIGRSSPRFTLSILRIAPPG